MLGCPFCDIPDERVVLRNSSCSAIMDAYPVTEGHMLVIYRHHVGDIRFLNDREWVDVLSLVEQCRIHLESSDDNIAGFNIGINCGAGAGQTIDHLHVHVIPRRYGDTPDPRGGVRGVIPERMSYPP